MLKLKFKTYLESKLDIDFESIYDDILLKDLYNPVKLYEIVLCTAMIMEFYPDKAKPEHLQALHSYLEMLSDPALTPNLTQPKLLAMITRCAEMNTLIKTKTSPNTFYM